MKLVIIKSLLRWTSLFLLTSNLLLAEAQQVQLDNARNLWNSWRITNYDFRYESKVPSHADPESHIIQVDGGDIIGITDEQSGSMVDEALFSDFFTIDGLFDSIQEAIDDRNNKVSISYDEEYGFPLTIYFENDPRPGDEETATINYMVPYTLYQRDLRNAIDDWVDLSLDDYDFVYQNICFCPPTSKASTAVEVRDGVVTSQIVIETGSSQRDSDIPTVLDQFGRIRNAIDARQGRIEVTYDRTYGHPQRVHFYGSSPNTSEPTGFHVSEFVPLRFTPEQFALTDARTLWELQGLKRYTYGYRKDCFCFPPYRAPVMVYVEDGIISNIVSREGREVLPEVQASIPTMENLFDRIQHAINTNADSVVVVYNDEYGYPESISVDYDFRMADEELNVEVDYLAPVSQWQVSLDIARDLWSRVGTDSYTYAYQKSCFCSEEETREKIVEVLNGVVVKVNGGVIRRVDSPQGQVSNSFIPPTITDLFDKIQDAIDGNAFDLQVTYDDVYGIPSFIRVDYDERIADEELVVAIRYPLGVTEDGAPPPSEHRPTEESDSPAPTGAPSEGGTDEHIGFSAGFSTSNQNDVVWYSIVSCISAGMLALVM